MRSLTIAVTLMLALPAFAAEMVAGTGGSQLRLSDAVCTNAGILSMLKDGHRAEFRAASATFKGKHFEACWISVRDEGAVFVVYEDGDHDMYPMADFKPDGM